MRVRVYAHVYLSLRTPDSTVMQVSLLSHKPADDSRNSPLLHARDSPVPHVKNSPVLRGLTRGDSNGIRERRDSNSSAGNMSVASRGGVAQVSSCMCARA